MKKIYLVDKDYSWIKENVYNISWNSEFYIGYNPTDEYFKVLEKIADFYLQKTFKQKKNNDIVQKFIKNIFLSAPEVEIEARLFLLINKGDIIYNYTYIPLEYIKEKNKVIDRKSKFSIYINYFFRTIKMISFFVMNDMVLLRLGKKIKRKKYKYIIRTWVDIAINIYSEIIEKRKKDVLLWVYPYNVNKYRRERAYNKIKELGVDYKPFIRTLKITTVIFLWSKFIEILLKGEKKGIVIFYKMRLMRDFFIVKEEAKKISSFCPDIILTKEEFMPESILFKSFFEQNKIKVWNAMHGTGLYYRYQKYDKFFVYSSFYKNFYKKTVDSEFILFSSFSYNYHEKRNKKRETNEMYIGIVMQYLTYSFSRKERNKMIRLISRLKEENEWNIVVKEHPHQQDSSDIEQLEGIKIIKGSKNELFWYETDIVITSFSTMGYESIKRDKIALFFTDKDKNLLPIKDVCQDFVINSEDKIIEFIRTYKQMSREEKEKILLKEKKCLSKVWGKDENYNIIWQEVKKYEKNKL